MEALSYNLVHANEVLSDDNNGYVYGIEWVENDGTEVVEVDWYETEARRTEELSKYCNKEIK